jgi:hypothetical protein
MEDHFAVIRMTTLKADDIAGAERHNLRLGEPEPNVDPSRTHLNRYLVGEEVGLLSRIHTRIKSAGVTRKVKDDAIVGIELMMTASPDFFDEDMRAGKSEKLDKWIEDSMTYARSFAGAENIMQAVLHMDETTPHLQVIFTPITNTAPSAKKTKVPQGERPMTLNAKPFTSPGKWQAMWTSYAKAMKGHGLRRGQQDNGAEHTSLKAGRKEVIDIAKGAEATALKAEALAEKTNVLLHDTMEKQQQILTHQTETIEDVVNAQMVLIAEQRSAIESLKHELLQAYETIKRLLGGAGSKTPHQQNGKPLSSAARNVLFDADEPPSEGTFGL